MRTDPPPPTRKPPAAALPRRLRVEVWSAGRWYPVGELNVPASVPLPPKGRGAASFVKRIR